MDTSEDTAQLDYDKLDSTLVLRKWMKGDTIYPLGMKGKKKLSDLLTDLKVPLHEKENIWVLCSGEEIIWILGIKISDRFKIIPKSKKYLKISLLYT